MSTPLVILLMGVGILMLTLIVFHIESRRGRRFGEGVRIHLDFWFLKVRHMVHVRALGWSKYFLRQIIHYFVHTLLQGTVGGLADLEDRLRAMARSNRALAKKSDKERTERNKLEEVALHKLEVALSEEEKRIRKQTSLEG